MKYLCHLPKTLLFLKRRPTTKHLRQATSIELPFSIYVLVMDKSKNQPYLHGFGLCLKLILEIKCSVG